MAYTCVHVRQFERSTRVMMVVVVARMAGVGRAVAQGQGGGGDFGLVAAPCLLGPRSPEARCLATRY